MSDADPGFHQRQMIEEAKNQLRGSGQFRTAQDLAEVFGIGLEQLRPQLQNWKARREVFSVQDESGDEMYPIFAFDQTRGIRPSEVIAKILNIFESRLSNLAIASWFIGLNSYLGDQCPKDLLEDEAEWVVEAAQDTINECSHG